MIRRLRIRVGLFVLPRDWQASGPGKVKVSINADAARLTAGLKTVEEATRDLDRALRAKR